MYADMVIHLSSDINATASLSSGVVAKMIRSLLVDHKPYLLREA